MVFQHLKYFLSKLFAVHCLVFRATKLEEFHQNRAETALINTNIQRQRKNPEIFFRQC
jgi:hypothetical protein